MRSKISFNFQIVWSKEPSHIILTVCAYHIVPLKNVKIKVASSSKHFWVSQTFLQRMPGRKQKRFPAHAGHCVRIWPPTCKTCTTSSKLFYSCDLPLAHICKSHIQVMFPAFLPSKSSCLILSITRAYAHAITGVHIFALKGPQSKAVRMWCMWHQKQTTNIRTNRSIHPSYLSSLSYLSLSHPMYPICPLYFSCPFLIYPIYPI